MYGFNLLSGFLSLFFMAVIVFLFFYAAILILPFILVFIGVACLVNLFNKKDSINVEVKKVNKTNPDIIDVEYEVLDK